MALLIGIDGGGTSCRAAVAAETGGILGRGRGGASNVLTSVSGALESITHAAGEALEAAALPSDAIAEADAVLGLAGANVGPYGQELLARLPFRRARIESDATIALYGALSEHDGAIGIVGTGTAYALKRGREVRHLGGWGFALGDGGSGAWLGWRVAEEVLLAFDGVRPSSPLAVRVLARFGGEPQAMVEWATAAKPGDFGALAPLLFDDPEDPLARELLDAGAAMVSASVRALALRPGERLALLGGLAEKTAPRLDPDLRPFLRPPQGDALDGAILLARQYWGAAP